MVSAEAIPEPAKERLAAQVLQRLGFRIISTDGTIYLEGEKSLFEETFAIQLEELSKHLLPGISKGAVRTYWRKKGELTIPRELEGLVRDVVFPEPPEFF